MEFEIFGYEISQWIVAYIAMCIPLFASWQFKTKIGGEIVIAALRATVQLFLMAIILIPIFNSGIIIQSLLIFFMMIMGALISTERGKKVPNRFRIAIIAIICGAVTIILLFISTSSIEIVPNEIIPISGMIIGNASRTVSLTFHKAYNDFHEHRSQVEAMLLDGANERTALFIPLHQTVKNSTVPLIDSLKTLGMVHIPGAMAGMIVGGIDPLVAAGYQILIFFGIVSTSTISAIIATYLSYKSIFGNIYPHLKKICKECEKQFDST